MALAFLRRSVEIGLYAFACWTLYRKIQFYFFPPKQSLSRYRRSPQAYAVVTGASAGIGYGFAENLAANGFGLVLMASRKERLEAAAQKIRSENPTIDVRTIVVNAQDVDGDAIASALEPIMHLPITVLVNNVGGVSMRPPFPNMVEVSSEHLIRTINMSATFMAQLTRIMIPTLDRNGPSLVLSMGSGIYVGEPWLVLYCATKAFVHSFSAGLARESRVLGWKIDSLGITVGEVESEANFGALGPGTPIAKDYAKIVLDRVEMAVDRKMWVTNPYWVHAVQSTLLEFMPEWLGQKMVVSSMREKKKLHEKNA